MPHVPGLRSPYAKVGRLVYFGRMLDKIRLHAGGRLPPEYVENLGDEGEPTTFDARCCRFLGVRHADLAKRALAGESDEAVLAWAEANGKAHTDEECDIWNMFMAKRGWRGGRPGEAAHGRTRRIGGQAGVHHVRFPGLRRGPRERGGTAVGANLSL